MRAKQLADYVLSKEAQIKVDTPLSVYVDTFIVLGQERNMNGELAFIQHVLNTDHLKNNENAEDEFPDIPKQVYRILDSIVITDEAKQIARKIGEEK